MDYKCSAYSGHVEIGPGVQATDRELCVLVRRRAMGDIFLPKVAPVTCWKEHELLLRKPTWTGDLSIVPYWSKRMNKSFASLRLSFLICSVGIIHNFSSCYVNEITTQVK